MLGPPARFWRILISRLIFFFFTGFNTLTMHFSSLTMWMPSKTYPCRLSFIEYQLVHVTCLGVLSAPNFPDNLIVVLGTPLNS